MRFWFGWDEDDDECIRLKLMLLQIIQDLRNNNVTQFMTACEPGVGLWCAEIVNILRDGDNAMILYSILPHEGQSSKWVPYLRERYFQMIEKCTYITAVSTHQTSTSQPDAYKYIIDESDIVLAVYASARGDDMDKTMDYVQTIKHLVILVHPDTFDVHLISERRH